MSTNLDVRKKTTVLTSATRLGHEDVLNMIQAISTLCLTDYKENWIGEWLPVNINLF